MHALLFHAAIKLDLLLQQQIWQRNSTGNSMLLAI